jgi:fructose/tagatose bisphosphate aldolase
LTGAVPVVAMKDLLDRALAGRYGVTAFNVVNDLTIEAVLAAAVAERAPVILQTSVKTVEMYGRRPLHDILQALARDVDVPVTLHLDHCVGSDDAPRVQSLEVAVDFIKRTGVDCFAPAIHRGCAKVNIFTALKEAYLKSGLDFLRKSAEQDRWDPPALFRHQRAAVVEMARRHVRLFGSSGRAW